MNRYGRLTERLSLSMLSTQGNPPGRVLNFPIEVTGVRWPNSMLI